MRFEGKVAVARIVIVVEVVVVEVVVGGCYRSYFAGSQFEFGRLERDGSLEGHRL